MRKIILIALLLNCMNTFAQKNKEIELEGNGQVYYSASSGNLGMGVSVKVDKGVKRVEYHNPIPNQPYNNFVYLEGVKKINLFAVVNRDSVSFYRYSIQVDDKQVITDATPRELARYPSRKKQNFDLGIFDIENKKLVISYYKIDDRSKVGIVIISNKPILPAKILYIFFYKREKGTSYVEMEDQKSLDIFKVDEKMKSLMVVMHSTSLDFLYQAILKDKSTGKIVFRSDNWRYDFLRPRNPYLLIDRAYFNQSGEYELLIIPRFRTGFRSKQFASEAEIHKYSIQIENEKIFSIKEIIIIGIGLSAIFGAILGASITYIKRKNQKKLRLTQQQKELSKIQLNNIRSQLNPHFMFNALASIQNLMNTNKIDEATRYLGKFARLTRNVLDHKELISLAEEKMLLEDYLQMEQFRFGFTYELIIDEDLNLSNIEIPTMLLQPFVENAVKHGISAMGNKGEIIVSFVKENENLILKVKDNGKGFKTDKKYTGLGLQLSKNRISLLNTIYPGTPMLLTMISETNGSEITITLTQWI